MSSHIRGQDVTVVGRDEHEICATSALSVVEWLKRASPEDTQLQLSVACSALLAISTSDGIQALTVTFDKMASQGLDPDFIRAIMKLPVNSSPGSATDTREVDGSVYITQIGRDRVLSATGKDNDRYGPTFSVDDTKRLRGKFGVHLLEIGGADNINTHSARHFGAFVGSRQHDN